MKSEACGRTKEPNKRLFVLYKRSVQLVQSYNMVVIMKPEEYFLCVLITRQLKTCTLYVSNVFAV